eukprot:579380-Pelagomonas_calceolata.AAC.4
MLTGQGDCGSGTSSSEGEGKCVHGQHQRFKPAPHTHVLPALDIHQALLWAAKPKATPKQF